MRIKKHPILRVSALALIGVWYLFEPWFVTFIDDGPYYATSYTGPVDSLPLYSELELRRFGRSLYRLETRLLATEDESVVVLRRRDRSIVWARRPLKPDGPLGPLELRRHHWTWYGGWRIGISPANQESGNLYLGTLGRFRFFNHSW